MDTLDQKQSVAICVIDLAKGFERKFPADLYFVEMCADLALQYYPNYTNAMILKAENTKKRFEKILQSTGAKYPGDILNRPDANALFSSMEKQYAAIHEIGFRTMPKDMYINWLNELRKEKGKYLNRAAVSNFTKSDDK
jgi:hypothetical protein